MSDKEYAEEDQANDRRIQDAVRRGKAREAARVKLTKAQARYLRYLSTVTTWSATGPNKAMCNKLVRLGVAAERVGFPTGFHITDAGRLALSEAAE